MEGNYSDACIVSALLDQFHQSFDPFVWSLMSLCLVPEFPHAGTILNHVLWGEFQRQRKAA